MPPALRRVPRRAARLRVRRRRGRPGRPPNRFSQRDPFRAFLPDVRPLLSDARGVGLAVTSWISVHDEEHPGTPVRGSHVESPGQKRREVDDRKLAARAQLQEPIAGPRSRRSRRRASGGRPLADEPEHVVPREAATRLDPDAGPLARGGDVGAHEPSAEDVDPDIWLLVVATSENLCTSGKWWDKTLCAKGSISTCHSILAGMPASRKAAIKPTSMPPMPE